jgi:hypothetical protein
MQTKDDARYVGFWHSAVSIATLSMSAFEGYSGHSDLTVHGLLMTPEAAFIEALVRRDTRGDSRDWRKRGPGSGGSGVFCYLLEWNAVAPAREPNDRKI